MFPLVLIAIGIVICIFVSTLSTNFMSVETPDRVESTLKKQLIVSTVLLLGVSYIAVLISFPESYFLKLPYNEAPVLMSRWIPYICSVLGLVSGMFIAAFTEYVTSHTYSPVRELADSCKAGAASNVTLGLALGYMSTLIPVIFIAVTAFAANKLMGYYGVFWLLLECFLICL